MQKKMRGRYCAIIIHISFQLKPPPLLTNLPIYNSIGLFGIFWYLTLCKKKTRDKWELLEKLRKTDLALEFIDSSNNLRICGNVTFFRYHNFSLFKAKIWLKNAEFSMRKEKPTVFFSFIVFSKSRFGPSFFKLAAILWQVELLGSKLF